MILAIILLIVTLGSLGLTIRFLVTSEVNKSEAKTLFWAAVERKDEKLQVHVRKASDTKWPANTKELVKNYSHLSLSSYAGIAVDGGLIDAADPDADEQLLNALVLAKDAAKKMNDQANRLDTLEATAQTLLAK